MFNKETEYALRGLVYIQLQNTCGRRPGIAEIAREIDAPHFFTAKILQRMVKHGFVRSLKGKGGGFYFEKDKENLSVIEVISATEGNKIFSDCVFGLNHCDNGNPCPLHEKYAPIREAINKLAATETIMSLSKQYMFKSKILV